MACDNSYLHNGNHYTKEDTERLGLLNEEGRCALCLCKFDEEGNAIKPSVGRKAWAVADYPGCCPRDVDGY